MNFTSIAEGGDVKLTTDSDTGAEPKGEVKGEGAHGPSTTETKEEEGGLLLEGVTALSNTSETAPECGADGTSITETKEDEKEKEEGASLLEGKAAPSDISETSPQGMAGVSAKKSQKKVRLLSVLLLGTTTLSCSLSQSKRLSCITTNPFGLYLNTTGSLLRGKL